WSSDVCSSDLHNIATFQFWLRPAARAPYQGLDTCGQFFRVERLDDIVVGAGLQAFNLVLPAAACGQNQDRIIQPGFAYLLNDIQPGRPGQPDIDNRDIDRIFSGEKRAFLAFASAVDGVAVIA